MRSKHCKGPKPPLMGEQSSYHYYSLRVAPSLPSTARIRTSTQASNDAGPTHSRCSQHLLWSATTVPDAQIRSIHREHQGSTVRLFTIGVRWVVFLAGPITIRRYMTSGSFVVEHLVFSFGLRFIHKAMTGKTDAAHVWRLLHISSCIILQAAIVRWRMRYTISLTDNVHRRIRPLHAGVGGREDSKIKASLS